MERGKIQVYYGNGQGKTSAALGNAIRAASNGSSVIVIQFMKGSTDSEYLKRLEPEVRFFRFERSPEGFDDLNDEEKQEEKQNIVNGLNYARKVLATDECDLLVLDEVLGLPEEGMATENDITGILKAKSLMASVIMTGRNLPDSIRHEADEVYNIVSEKQRDQT
jgi:cob(I)alamin adenosyltransferase